MLNWTIMIFFKIIYTTKKLSLSTVVVIDNTRLVDLGLAPANRGTLATEVMVLSPPTFNQDYS